MMNSSDRKRSFYLPFPGLKSPYPNATGQAGSSPGRRCHVASCLAFRLGDVFTSTGRGHREVATRTSNEVMKNAGDVEIWMNLLFLEVGFGKVC